MNAGSNKITCFSFIKCNTLMGKRIDFQAVVRAAFKEINHREK
jgi:hypothetical protein